MSIVNKVLAFRAEMRRLIVGLFCPRILEAELARKTLNQMLKARWEINDTEVLELINENYESAAEEAKAVDQEQHYVVFIDCAMDVDWMTKGALENDRSATVTQAEAIGARRCEHLPREQRMEFKRLIGHAVVCGIRGARDNSQKLAKEAAKFLKERTIERSRVWTLSYAHLLGGLFGAVLFWIATESYFLSSTTDNAKGLLLGAIGGLLGAYLSVLLKAGSGEWDAASGKAIHAIEVGTKCIAGILFGAIAFILTRSAHAPPSIKAITPDNYSLFVLAIAAGLTERLIPKMVSKYTEKPTKPE